MSSSAVVHHVFPGVRVPLHNLLMSTGTVWYPGTVLVHVLYCMMCEHQLAYVIHDFGGIAFPNTNAIIFDCNSKNPDPKIEIIRKKIAQRSLK